MAKALLNKGEQPGLRKMANDIISAQTKEIAQMEHWRQAGTAPQTSPCSS